MRRNGVWNLLHMDLWICLDINLQRTLWRQKSAELVEFWFDNVYSNSYLFVCILSNNEQIKSFNRNKLYII